MERAGLLFETEDGRCRFFVDRHTPPVIVGRAPPYEPQNVRLRVPAASRRILRLAPAPDGTVTVEDDGSTGGVYVDEVRLTGPRAVAPGMRLRIAPFTTLRARPFRGRTVMAVGWPPSDVPPDVARVGDVLRLGRDVLRALGRVHAKGDVHGNIDPNHLLVAADGGRAELLVPGWTVLDPDGVLSCNPVYCPPELFDTNQLGAPGDVYALGLVLFEQMFGRRPFPADTPMDNIAWKRFGGAPDWGPRPPSTALQDFFLAMLLVRPDQRAGVDAALARLFELRPELSD